MKEEQEQNRRNFLERQKQRWDQDPLLREVYQHPELTPTEFINALELRISLEVEKARKGSLGSEEEQMLENLPYPPKVTED